MDRAYWNQKAGCYEEDIFSVRHHDRRRLIARRIRKHGGKNQVATDAGCGIGHFLPLLADRFRRVTAVDLSPRCIAKARAAHPDLANVTYRTVDLAQPGARLPKADFALCVNVAISPVRQQRRRLLNSVARHLRPGGHLVLVVPALESVLLTDFRLIEWNLRDGRKPETAAGSGFRAFRPVRRPRLHEGVVDIDGVPTKHYLKEEVQRLLETRGLRPLAVEKLEYPWNTEFTRPPRWMQAPFPWDWLVTTRKV